MAILFRDRVQAASMLSSGIRSFVSKHNLKNIVRKDNNDVIIMAIPRGGVVTADIVAINLERKLDILISAKIGALLSKSTISSMILKIAKTIKIRVIEIININVKIRIISKF